MLCRDANAPQWCPLADEQEEVLNVKQGLLKGSLVTTMMLMGSALAEDRLVFVVPESANAMPMARIDDGEVRAGLHLDMARLISAELNLNYEIVVTARARIDRYFSDAQVDVWCYSRPEWTQQSLHFSMPILHNSEAIVWHRDATPLGSVDELRGVPVGTITGFFYPVLNRLGDDLIRDDSPGFENNVLKLTNSRVAYLYVDELLFDYYTGFYPNMVPVAGDRLRVNSFDAHCALRPDGPVTVDAFNAALQRLRDDGSWQALFERYYIMDHYSAW